MKPSSGTTPPVDNSEIVPAPITADTDYLGSRITGNSGDGLSSLHRFNLALAVAYPEPRSVASLARAANVPDGNFADYLDNSAMVKKVPGLGYVLLAPPPQEVLAKAQRLGIGKVGPRLDIPEALKQAGIELQGALGDEIPLARLTQRAHELCGFPLTSIIPSDYCYNRENKGSRKRKRFLWKGKGIYQYVGEGYSYSGEIIREPKGG
jgi:hypothetical protein